MITVIHLMVADPSGHLQTGGGEITAKADGDKITLAKSEPTKWRIACGRRMKHFSEREGALTHVCTPDPKVLIEEKVSHCAKCRQSPEFLNDEEVAVRTLRPGGTLTLAAPADAA